MPKRVTPKLKALGINPRMLLSRFSVRFWARSKRSVTSLLPNSSGSEPGTSWRSFSAFITSSKSWLALLAMRGVVLTKVLNCSIRSGTRKKKPREIRPSMAITVSRMASATPPGPLRERWAPRTKGARTGQTPPRRCRSRPAKRWGSGSCSRRTPISPPHPCPAASGPAFRSSSSPLLSEYAVTISILRQEYLHGSSLSSMLRRLLLAASQEPVEKESGEQQAEPRECHGHQYALGEGPRPSLHGEGEIRRTARGIGAFGDDKQDPYSDEHQAREEVG